MQWETRPVDGVPLKAPVQYWFARKDEIDAVDNGCGPKTRFGLIAWLVPDSFFGIDFRPACRVHDFSWYLARAYQDYVESDQAFRDNLFALVEHSSTPRWLLWWGRWRATTYYSAVSEAREAKFLPPEERQRLRKRFLAFALALWSKIRGFLN